MQIQNNCGAVFSKTSCLNTNVLISHVSFASRSLPQSQKTISFRTNLFAMSTVHMFISYDVIVLNSNKSFRVKLNFGGCKLNLTVERKILFVCLMRAIKLKIAY